MRVTFGTVITTITLTTACASEPMPEPSRGVHVRLECPARADSTFYFPPEATDGQRVEYPSQFLGEINAPSLSCGNAVDAGYRMTRLAPGRPSAVIEVVHSQDGWTLRGFELASAVYLQRGTTTRKIRKNVTDSEAAALSATFTETGFWRAEALNLSGAQDYSYDGPWVSLEARRGSSYHVVFPVTQRFESITSKFFEMAGFDSR
jgi:hypothetical protein